MSEQLTFPLFLELTSYAADSHARISAKQATDAAWGLTVQDPGCGANSGASSERSTRGSPSSKTLAVTLPQDGCPRCGVICTCLDVERAPSGWMRETLGLPTRVPESSLWPTPTATANQLCPSMLKHPGCARLQKLAGTGGKPSPELFEWMMGFPEGWTEID